MHILNKLILKMGDTPPQTPPFSLQWPNINNKQHIKYFKLYFQIVQMRIIR